jgi:SnoaL-like domain
MCKKVLGGSWAPLPTLEPLSFRLRGLQPMAQPHPLSVELIVLTGRTETKYVPIRTRWLQSREGGRPSLHDNTLAPTARIARRSSLKALRVSRSTTRRIEVSQDDLTAKQEIYEVILKYCRGLDRLDLDLVRAAYHPGGIDNHTGFSGTIEEFIAWTSGTRLNTFQGTMHIIGNHLAEINGDRAVSETYGTAVHWGEPADDPKRNYTSGFRYVDKMQRRDGTWGIVERWAIREWTQSNVGRDIKKEGSGPEGRRDRDDYVYKAKAWTFDRQAP